MEGSYQRIIFLLILTVVAIEGSDELRLKLKEGLFDTRRILVNINYDYVFLNQQCWLDTF